MKNGRLKISLAAAGGFLLTVGGIVLVFGMKYGVMDDNVQGHEIRIQKVESSQVDAAVWRGKVETTQAAQTLLLEKIDKKLDNLKTWSGQ
jgi:hypothetical protein